jgi:hypothetical protein
MHLHIMELEGRDLPEFLPLRVNVRTGHQKRKENSMHI